LPATTPVAYRQLLTGLKQLVFDPKTRHPYEHNRNRFRITFAAFIDMHQHLIDGIAMIRLFLAATEHGLNDLPTPVQL
jgi:hypothetical protein